MPQWDDGFIDVDELYEAQKKIGGKLSRAEIKDVIWEVDDDRDGSSMADYLTVSRTQNDECVLCHHTTMRHHAPPPCASAARCSRGPLLTLAYGFEPKRFYAIVEFLLMDRDCLERSRSTRR